MFGVSSEMRREARELVARARSCEQMAPSMLECPTYTDANLLDDINGVLGEQATKALARIDVEALAGGGVRLGELRQEGFTTIADVYLASPKLLAEVTGVGDVSAETLLRRARAAHDEAMLGCAVHLDAETRPQEHTALIRNLYWQHRLQPLEGPIEETRTYLQKVSMEAEEASHISGMWKTLFSGREQRERAMAAVAALRSDLPVLSQRLDQLSTKVLAIISTPADTIWDDFAQRAAEYYARISALAPVAERRRAGNTPEALAQVVDGYPLDTSLLRATLRPYQVFGTQFALLQERTLLADEMGLGKTVEAIAVLTHRAAHGATHFLVVCPLSVLVNWEREVPRHSALLAMEVYGDDRDLEFHRWCREGGVAVTTYETLQRVPWDEAPPIDCLIVDEAHYVKNPDTKRAKAVARIMEGVPRVLFLTGTPLENRVGEMTALLGMLDGDLARRLMNERLMRNPVAYRREISSRYLRRTREDVLTELPEKIEKTDWCVMTDVDRDDYLASLKAGRFTDLRRVGWHHGDLTASSKAARLRELVDEAKADGTKVLVYTYFLHTLSLVEELLGEDCAGVINGSVPARERQRTIDDFAQGDRTVLACQVTSGGQGLNIQAASVVIFCEPQLKPSAEEQAISRAYRMGQVRTVMVHRLLMANTVDERIDELLRSKTVVFDEYADRSEVAEQEREIVDLRQVREIVASEVAKHGVERDADAAL